MEEILVNMEKILVKMEKMEKMEKILAILEKMIVTIPSDPTGSGWPVRVQRATDVRN
jgi:hypothetical protein